MTTPDDPAASPSGDELGEVVRRLVRRMILLGVVGATYFVFTADIRGLGILTVTVAVSIFLVRSLEAHVASLDVRRAPQRARTLVFALVRHLLLATGLILVLFVDVSRPAALILGVSTLPAALLAETLSSFLRTRRA